MDSKIALVRQVFNIRKVDDWTELDPRDILAIDGIGEATLNHIRLYIAGQGRTLKNDRTPGYWMEEFGRAKVVHQMADDDRAIICPFTVLIDSAETQPFSFQGLRCDADLQHRPLIVKTQWQSLGRHPHSLGDYSIEGHVGRVHVERKSVEDFQSTLLGFKSDRRARFECELVNLSKVEAAAVVVEGTFLTAIQVSHDHSQKSRKTNAKVLLRSVLALQQDYRVPWLFCDSRRMAEIVTFRFLERFWRKQAETRKQSERLLAEM